MSATKLSRGREEFRNVGAINREELRYIQKQQLLIGIGYGIHLERQWQDIRG